MKYGRLADFFFVGLAIVPAALAFGGLPHVAILLFIPLLFVACLFGMAEQVEPPGPRTREPAGDAGSASRDSPGCALRNRSSPEGPPKT